MSPLDFVKYWLNNNRRNLLKLLAASSEANALAGIHKIDISG